MRQLASPHHQVLTTEQAADFAEVLWALGNGHRLRIMSLLLHTPGGMTVARLAGHVRLTDAATSHHMKLLAAAGLVERPRRVLPYRVVPGALEYVAAFLGGAG